MFNYHSTLDDIVAPSTKVIVSEGVTESVLLVESDDELRGRLSTTLRREGFHVIEAATGRSAIEVLRTMKGVVEWLVTNVHLSGLSGLHVAFEYRYQFPLRPIVFMDDGQYSSDPYLLTFSRWLPQPYTGSKLLLLMKELRADKHELTTMGC